MPKITVELTKGIRVSCANHTTRGCACSRARSQQEFVEVTQYIPQERIVVVVPSASVQEQIVGVAKNIPQERVQWRRGSDRGRPNATDHG